MNFLLWEDKVSQQLSPREVALHLYLALDRE